VLEAMACGLPCVAASTSGSRELIVDGETGLTYEPDDAAGLAAAVRRCLGPDGERMGEAALRIAEARYSIRCVADRYEALYAELLSGAPRRAGVGLPEPLPTRDQTP
jgi:glycosyltransferase involved in cell wall biosynthesis